MTNQEAYEMLCDVCAKAEKYDKMINVLQEIRQEISDKMAYPGYDIAISIGMKKALDILNDKIKEYTK